MAINNGRYVVTGGYMNPDGTIVEERQRVPNDNTGQNTTSGDNMQWVDSLADSLGINRGGFSPAEVYKLQADGYYNLGETNLGDAYSALWKGSDAYSNTAKLINDFYSQLGGDVAQREMALAGIKSDLADKLYNDMSQTRQYVMDTFGPQGTLTTEINRYYDDLGNYLSSEAGREAAKIAAQGMHSGASLGSIRAQQDEAYNQAFGRYVQAKEQEINAKQQIASNLINFMSTLRQEYGDTTNQYIIQQYQRANDLLNAISQSIANSNIELSSVKLSGSLGGGGGGSSSVTLPAGTASKLYNSLSDADKAAFDALPASQQQQILLSLYYQSLKTPGTTETTTNKPTGLSWSAIVKNWNSSKKY